jgi:hypothetical protein
MADPPLLFISLYQFYPSIVFYSHLVSFFYFISSFLIVSFHICKIHLHMLFRSSFMCKRKKKNSSIYTTMVKPASPQRDFSIQSSFGGGYKRYATNTRKVSGHSPHYLVATLIRANLRLVGNLRLYLKK